MKKSEIIDYFWSQGYFEEYRKPSELSKKMWNEYKIDAGNIIMTLKSKKYLKNFPRGWKQIKPFQTKTISKTEDMVEIERLLGNKFEKEISELKIALIHQPNCGAFLMRKIMEKLLFIIITKSNYKIYIDNFKRDNEGELPSMKNLLNWAQTAEINNIHIATPRNLKNFQGSKFLGDTAAHNYLISVGAEDLKLEFSNWRILVKELASQL